MDNTPAPPEPSFFRPRGTTMRSEVRVISMILSGWLAAIVGFQLFAYYLEKNYSELLITDFMFINLPIQFWLSGQLLPLWFIILCVLFNLWMDRRAAQNMEESFRFRIRPSNEEDE